MEVEAIYTKYPCLVFDILKSKLQLRYKPSLPRYAFMQVPIIPDTWESLEEKVAFLAREQGKNILAADIVSSGESARKAGLVIRETLMKVEYALYTSITSLSDRRVIYQMFQTNQTMIWAYAKKEFQMFFGKLFGWYLDESRKALNTLERETIRNYKQYIENKLQLGRYEDPIDINVGIRLIQREISFLKENLCEEREVYY
jgi:hypothetical protein